MLLLPPANLVSTFTPLKIPGLRLWLDAADAATVLQAAGSVFQWNDKSGLGNHATQAIGASQPQVGTRFQNGRNVIDFQGSHSMDLPSGMFDVSEGPNTVIIAMVNDDVSLINRTVYGSNLSGRHFYIRTASSDRIAYNCSSGQSQTVNYDAINIVDAQPFIVMGWNDSVDQFISVDGGAQENFGVPTIGLTQLECELSRAAAPVDAGLFEVIVSDQQLSANLLKTTGRYLYQKWATNNWLGAIT